MAGRGGNVEAWEARRILQALQGGGGGGKEASYGCARERMWDRACLTLP